MKKCFLFLVSCFLILSCGSSKMHSDFDYSFSISGGEMPFYENFLIRGHDGFYSYEKEGKKTTRKFKVSKSEINELESVLKNNRFKMIEEDFKKIYGRVNTSVYVKKGENAARKSDASLIMPKDQTRWNSVVAAFQKLLDSKISQKNK